jgi:hypothetical protein
MQSVKEICGWMDDKNHKLIDCYRSPGAHGYETKRLFLEDLAQVSEDIARTREQDWQSISIGRCLKGLKGLRADERAVTLILRQLTIKIDAATVTLDAQHIGNALYGLQNMGSNVAAVQDVLVALTRKIHASDATLNGQEIGNALYGLQKMSYLQTEVSDTLGALEAKFTAINFDADRLAWYQCVVSYVQLAKNSSTDIPLATLQRFFTDLPVAKSAYSADEVCELLVRRLQEHQVQGGGMLDLHGLDYLCAKLLLQTMVTDDALRQGCMKGIISGRGSHSCMAHRGIMRDMVSEHLATLDHASVTWSADQGSLVFNTPVAMRSTEKVAAVSMTNDASGDTEGWIEVAPKRAERPSSSRSAPDGRHGGAQGINHLNRMFKDEPRSGGTAAKHGPQKGFSVSRSIGI